MSVFLTKVLQTLVYPASLVVLCLVLALGFGAFRFRRLSLALSGLALAIMWGCSLPVTSVWLIGGLEARYPPRPVAAFGHEQAALLLGGMISPAYPPRVTPDLGPAIDRVIFAKRLHEAGVADRILVIGGNVSWMPDAPSESEMIRDLLVEFGVSPEVILLEGRSQNTRQNASGAAALMARHGITRALLVTSGAHMPRAMATFRRAGIDVVPATAEVSVTSVGRLTLLDFLPSASALAGTTFALKEHLGLLVYSLKGWA
ncbi:MAG: YdcF family protein [Pseudomonadota bacterium]|nr:YdcF family protein [Pseudomonadota bacterium]